MASSSGPELAVQKMVVRAAPSNARSIGMGDEVAVHYVGRLQKNGYVFDSSRERGREFVLLLGAGGVIKGWELGLQQMRVGEVAKLICPPEVAYGKKGIPDKVPPNSTLEFEIEVLTACKPIMKDILSETESNLCPKEDDYVRVHMVVKSPDGTVRDDYFSQRPLEFYMKDHVANSEYDGTWKAGNLLKKLVEQMCLNEKAAFTVHEAIMDKYGNKPFWAKDDGPVTIELDLKVIGKDEDLSGDGGVVKHKIHEGEGYEKATDGAHLSFVYRILTGSRAAGRIRETESGGESPASGADESGGKNSVHGLDAAYEKWSKLKITDDGEVEPQVPKSVEQALSDAERSKAASKSEVLFEAWDVSKPARIFCGFGETAEGLEDALMTMKKHEHAIVSIAPDFGFGGHDQAAPCEGLPINSTLHYEVLLLDIGKGLEHWNLDANGKRLHAERKRARGNDFFKRGNLRRALKLYQPVVDKMGYFMKMPKRPSDAARAHAASQQYAGHKIHNVANTLEPDNTAETPEVGVCVCVWCL
jgi:FK506-binding protein 1